jgi:hypothetical protein
VGAVQRSYPSPQFFALQSQQAPRPPSVSHQHTSLSAAAWDCVRCRAVVGWLHRGALACARAVIEHASCRTSEVHVLWMEVVWG